MRRLAFGNRCFRLVPLYPLLDLSFLMIFSRISRFALLALAFAGPQINACQAAASDRQRDSCFVLRGEFAESPDSSPSITKLEEEICHLAIISHQDPCGTLNAAAEVDFIEIDTHIFSNLGQVSVDVDKTLFANHMLLRI